MLNQIAIPVSHFTGDTAYDKNVIYQKITDRFPLASVVIPPSKNALLRLENHKQRNNNIIDIAFDGRMAWQRKNNYGKRNYSELAIQRYKRILGNSLQSREIKRQKQEAMIGCGVLNKMTSFGMPVSYKT